MVNLIWTFSFISLRILMINCWYFLCIAVFPSSLVLYQLLHSYCFLWCLNKLLLSSCLKAGHWKLCAVKGAYHLWSLGGSNWAARLGNLRAVSSGLSTWALIPQRGLLQSLAWRSGYRLLPMFWRESLWSSHLGSCQYATLPPCSPSQKPPLYLLRYKPLVFCWWRCCSHLCDAQGGVRIWGSSSFGWSSYFYLALRLRRTQCS